MKSNRLIMVCAVWLSMFCCGASHALQDDPRTRTLAELPANEWPTSEYSAAQFSRDGNTFAMLTISEATTTFRLWDVHRAVPISSWKVRYLRNFVLSPDGHRVATITYGQRKSYTRQNFVVHVRDVRTGKSLRTFVPTDVSQSAFSASAWAWSDDGMHLAVGGGDGRVRVWNTRSGKQRTFLAPSSFVESLAFSPDSKKLSAGVSWAPDNTLLYLWTLNTGRVQRVRLPKEERKTTAPATFSVMFSPDSKRLFTRRLFRAEGGQFPGTVIYSLPHLSVLCAINPLPHDSSTSRGGLMALSWRGDKFALSQEKWFAQPSLSWIGVGDAKTGQVSKRYNLPNGRTEGVLALSFAPDTTLRWVTTAEISTGYRISLWSTRR